MNIIKELTLKQIEELAVLNEEITEVLFELELKKNHSELKNETVDFLIALSFFKNDIFELVFEKKELNSDFNLKHFKLKLFQLQKILSKILRFGFVSYCPLDPEKKTNLKLLEQELISISKDIYSFIHYLSLSDSFIKERLSLKIKKLSKFSFFLNFNNLNKYL